MPIRGYAPAEAVRKAYEDEIGNVKIPPPRAGEPAPPTLPAGFPTCLEVWGIEPDQLDAGQPPQHRSFRFPAYRNGRVTVGEVRGAQPKLTRVSYGLGMTKAAQAAEKMVEKMKEDHQNYELRILTSSRLLSEAFWLYVDDSGESDVLIPFNTTLRELPEGKTMTMAEYLNGLRLAAQRLAPDQPQAEPRKAPARKRAAAAKTRPRGKKP